MNEKQSKHEKDHLFSLLWPEYIHKSGDKVLHTIDPQTYKDLDLEFIISSFTFHLRYKKDSPNSYAHLKPDQNFLAQILGNPCTDTRIIEYRLNILEDLMQNPQLVESIRELLPVFDLFGRRNYSPRRKKDDVEIYYLTARLSELEGYIHCVQKFEEAFSHLQQDVRSRGLKKLQTFIEEITVDEVYQQLKRELPDILSRIRGIRSISIGVNLDKDLLPVEATLLSVNKEKFHGAKGLFKKLFSTATDAFEGIAQLHSAPVKEYYAHGRKMIMDPDVHGYAVNPILIPLFKDLSVIIKRVSTPIIKALRKYISIKGNQFSGLKNEFHFYLGAINMIQVFKSAGLPMCRPRLSPKTGRKCSIKDSYNIGLAFSLMDRDAQGDMSTEIVKNDVEFGPEGRIIILTGPNRGGKTTYTQGVGIAQVFAQTGLYVPGTEAEISPVDSIYTHFPIEEKVDKGTGRLGDEAQRLYEILSAITGQSLLLLNESFSSTSPGEGFSIARDVVRVLRAIGAHAVFATHLHELGVSVDDINASIDGPSKVISMVALTQDTHHERNTTDSVVRTFKIRKGPPEGQSYAAEIAAKYGISFTQLEDLFARRGLLKK